MSWRGGKSRLDGIFNVIEIFEKKKIRIYDKVKTVKDKKRIRNVREK